MANTIIEVSGLDYTGKTTQATLLTYETWGKHLHNFGAYSGYAKGKLPEDIDPQVFFKWWFEASSFAEITDALATAYNERQRIASSASEVDIAIVERGITMLKAQLIGNFATRANGAVEDYIEMVDHLLKGTIEPPHPGVTNIEVHLTPDFEWQQQQAKYMPYTRNQTTGGTTFTDTQNEFYDRYLANTAAALGHVSRINCSESIEVNAPAIDVQNAIRQHGALEHLGLPPMLSHNPIVLGFAGLSESGKSAIAEELARQHGFTRMKLGYFNESRRTPHTKYADPHTIAMNAVHFVATNRHIDRMTLESLHGPHLGAYLKILLGDRWKSLFIDLSDEARTERLKQQYPDRDIEQLLDDQRQKDATKLASGVAEYRELADLVVDNSSTLHSAVSKIIGEVVNEQ